MLDPHADLKRELPLGLEKALEKHLLPTEVVTASLPGGFGEGLAVTDKRVLIIRERDSGINAGCDVFSYSLNKVNGAAAVPSNTGGYIEVKLADPPPQPDAARVYFPSYELSKFESLAQYVTELAQSQSRAPAAPAPGPAPAAAVSPEHSGVPCPECGAAASERDVFCAKCGHQLRVVCSACSGASPVDSQYCTHCGTRLAAFAPECPNCGVRVQRWMSFCPGCGSALGAGCAACGMRIEAAWKHCASCGRLLGSDTIDASAARSLQRRLLNRREAERMSDQPTAPPAEQQTGPDDRAAARLHNDRGQELFENDQFEEAVREFEQAVKLDPQNATYHCNLAVSLDEADMDEDALAEYERTLELEPNDLTALLSLGYMYNENGQLEKAQSVWSKILVVAPGSAEAQEVRDNLTHQENL